MDNLTFECVTCKHCVKSSFQSMYCNISNTMTTTSIKGCKFYEREYITFTTNRL